MDGSCDAAVAAPVCCWTESPRVRVRERGEKRRISSLLLCGRRSGVERQKIFSFGSPSRASHPHSLALFKPSQRLDRARRRGRPASPLPSKKRILFINIPSVFSPPPLLHWFPPFFRYSLRLWRNSPTLQLCTFCLFIHCFFSFSCLPFIISPFVVLSFFKGKKTCTRAKVRH